MGGASKGQGEGAAAHDQYYLVSSSVVKISAAESLIGINGNEQLYFFENLLFQGKTNINHTNITNLILFKQFSLITYDMISIYNTVQ